MVFSEVVTKCLLQTGQEMYYAPSHKSEYQYHNVKYTPLQVLHSKSEYFVWANIIKCKSTRSSKIATCDWFRNRLLLKLMQKHKQVEVKFFIYILFRNTCFDFFFNNYM